MKDGIRDLFSGYYNILLICLALLFIFRPYYDSKLYIGVWNTLLSITIITAVFNCRHSKIIKYIIAFLAIFPVFAGWLHIFYTHTSIFLLNVITTPLFLAVCAGSILYDVVLRARVTFETLRGVICAYFLLAFVFAYIYSLIEFMEPGTFLIYSKPIPFYPNPVYFSEIIYFSFITLLTIGYGDIVATQTLGQTFSVLEGMIGQFYIAILVARLVAVYSYKEEDKRLLRIEKALERRDGR